MLVIPAQLVAPAAGAPDTRDGDWAPVVDAAAQLCVSRRAMLLLDPPFGWADAALATTGATPPPVPGVAGRNAAIFFPRLRISDPLGGPDRTVGPIGAVAGVWARTDTTRGVWKAPAGMDAALVGVAVSTVPLTDRENGVLNQLGVNCLRRFPVYRTVRVGRADLPRRRRARRPVEVRPGPADRAVHRGDALRGTQWVVFEPNDEPLWASIRLNVGAFMNDLFRQGAFQGRRRARRTSSSATRRTTRRTTSTSAS